MSAAERLGERLRAAGFHAQRAVDLRAEGGDVVPPVESLLALGRSEDAHLAVMLRLFNNCQMVARAHVHEALNPLALDELVDAGLIELDGSRVRACLRLSAFEGLIFAGDPVSGVKDPDHVASLTRASRLTAYLTARREIESAADLGTGSGVQALLASRHAARVVGVDINAHALSLARLSQRLNGIDDRVSWVEGSWLEPLHGEQFDLVVANPPYVISPENAFLYRDSEAAGDELSREVVRACAGALTEDGCATVMCNWIHRGDDWEDPVRQWVAGLGCDALVLRQFSQDPLVYAMVWHLARAATDPDAFSEGVSRWVAHYKRVGIERIATGFIVLRRRSDAANWLRPLDIGMPHGAGSDQLQRMFSAGDLLHAGGGAGSLAQLLSRPWRLLEGHRLNQSALYVDGAYVGEGAMTCQPDMGVHATIDPRVLPVLLHCDGERSLGELIADVAVPADLDRAAFHSLCLGAARDLIARGYLLGVED